MSSQMPKWFAAAVLSGLLAFPAAKPRQVLAGQGEPAQPAAGRIVLTAPEVVPSTVPDGPQQPAAGADQQSASAPDSQGQDQPGPEDRPDPKRKAEPELPEPARGLPRPPLTPQQASLRDRVRRLLAWYSRLPVNTAEHTPAQVLQFCLAFGCDSEVRSGGPGGEPVSAFGALCFNFPCAGYQMLTTSDGQVMARVGYAFQAAPGQMLAVLAQSAVPASYEIRAGQQHWTVADLVEYEKKTCRAGTNLSFKLIGLSFYVPQDASWQDELGQTWSLERLCSEECRRQPAPHNADVVHHLTALSWAVKRRSRTGGTLEPPYRQAQEYLARFEAVAFRTQNPDGTWHPHFFTARGSSPDQTGLLLSTGHILGWLAYWLPDQRLDDPHLLRAVQSTTNLLEQRSSGWDLSDASPREVSAVTSALYALRLYDRRFFKVREPAGLEARLGGSHTRGDRGGPRGKR